MLLKCSLKTIYDPGFSCNGLLTFSSFVLAVGKNKKEAVKVYGKDKVKSWRRAYDDPPPPMEDDHEFHPALDPRYRHVREKDLACADIAHRQH